MELWQAIETYMERNVDFVNEVRIVDDGDGLINVSDITWNIIDKVKPTQEQLDTLLAQDYMVKIYRGPYGFIWAHCKPFENIDTELIPEIIACPFAVLPECVDPVYKLPYRRYQNGTVHEITDPIEYQDDPVIWMSYQKKVRDEIHEMLRTKTNAEIKAVYDVSPYYKQEMIFNAIHYFWSERMPQYDFNLAAEVLLRYITEFFYVTQVQNSTFTEGQRASFNAMITEMHNHNVMLKNNPYSPEGEILDVNNWPHVYMPQMLGAVSLLRSICIPQRIEICGR
jgi:hypothetical protein